MSLRPPERLFHLASDIGPGNTDIFEHAIIEFREVHSLLRPFPPKKQKIDECSEGTQ